MPRTTRSAGSQGRTKITADKAKGKEKNKSEANTSPKVKRPYPSSCPLRDSARPNKKAAFAIPSPTEPNVLSTQLLEALPRPPPSLLAKTSSSSSSRSDPPDLGMPTREAFALMEEQYLASLDPRKQAKALICQEMFDKIWLVLHYPKDNTIGSPQFRWWVRKMFYLVPPEALPGGLGVGVGMWHPVDQQTGETTYVNAPLQVVVHDGKRVAIREQIYDILCVCHERVKHGGRDKTAVEIRKTYTWVPKDLIALFVKNCPTCICKRTGPVEDRAGEGTAFLPRAPPPTAPTLLDNAAFADVMARYLPMPPGDMMFDARPPFDVPPGNLSPWSTSSYLGPPAGSGFLVGGGAPNGLSAALPPNWHVPPASDPSGGGFFYFPDGGPGSLAFPQLPPHLEPMFDSVQLPRIQVYDAENAQDPLHPANAKVTLPSLSQVFSGALTLNRNVRVRAARQPLQALSNNVNPFLPLHIPVPPDQPQQIPAPFTVNRDDDSYVPVIDPVLLQDGIQMLAFAAEASQAQAREAGLIQGND